jgi:probable HAF family extracellular repeat protein
MHRTTLLLLTPLLGLMMAGAVVAATPATATPRCSAFQIRDLTDLGNGAATPVTAEEINDRGLVAGSASTPEGFSRAYRADPRTGAFVVIGTLGGTSSTGEGINARGQVVGGSDTATGEFHAFVWHPATGLADLGTLGGTVSRAFAINDAGVVVGESATENGPNHAFVWDPRTGEMTDLGTLGGDFSQAFAINNRGQIAGTATTADGVSHAFLWDPGTRQMTDLGVLPGTVVSFGLGINQRGLVVGYAAGVEDNSDQAFRWTPSTGMQPLDVQGSSQATAINSLGVVVGFTFLEQLRAFVRDPATGSISYLPVLGGGGAIASDVNTRCQVVGRAQGTSGIFVPVLWTPTSSH